MTQLVDLANLLRPGVEWPTPSTVEEWEANIARLTPHTFDNDTAAAELQATEARLAQLITVWKTAARRWPPRAGDPGIGRNVRALRGSMVVLRQSSTLYPFHGAGALYGGAYFCRELFREIARVGALHPRPTTALNFHLPPMRPQLQMMAGGTLMAGMSFWDFIRGIIHGIDGTLIRTCRECGKLLLAWKGDQTFCAGGKCQNKFRQREWRRTHPAYHKRKEREGRALESQRRAFTVPQKISELI